MSQSELQTIIGTAITDSAFRRRLLESPAKVADEFELTSTERVALLDIRADSLSDLAEQLDEWLQANNDYTRERLNGDSKESKKWVLLG